MTTSELEFAERNHLARPNTRSIIASHNAFDPTDPGSQAVGVECDLSQAILVRELGPGNCFLSANSSSVIVTGPQSPRDPNLLADCDIRKQPARENGVLLSAASRRRSARHLDRIPCKRLGFSTTRIIRGAKTCAITTSGCIHVASTRSS